MRHSSRKKSVQHGSRDAAAVLRAFGCGEKDVSGRLCLEMRIRSNPGAKKLIATLNAPMPLADAFKSKRKKKSGASWSPGISEAGFSSEHWKEEGGFLVWSDQVLA